MRKNTGSCIAKPVNCENASSSVESARAEGWKSGERLAKRMARCGVASRRQAERLICEGKVSVNGVTVLTPVFNLSLDDEVRVSGQCVFAEQTRLFAFYKPQGIITTTYDDKQRTTVFDILPEGVPRLLSVGRLDISSEGLLLLTNDGALKRRFERPENAFERKYRVRVRNRRQSRAEVVDSDFDLLREGMSISGIHYLPANVTLERVKKGNSWINITLKEGKNREIRRMLEAIDFNASRLIRTSFGPFTLEGLAVGELKELSLSAFEAYLGDSIEL